MESTSSSDLLSSSKDSTAQQRAQILSDFNIFNLTSVFDNIENYFTALMNEAVENIIKFASV